MISSWFCLIHPLTLDKLVTPSNIHINHQYYKRYLAINNNYSRTITQ